eukprot:170678-Amphidinium_carterae.1
MALCLDMEVPKKFVLVSDPWTPENDMLTAALKLKRPLIADRHKALQRIPFQHPCSSSVLPTFNFQSLPNEVFTRKTSH